MKLSLAAATFIALSFVVWSAGSSNAAPSPQPMGREISMADLFSAEPEEKFNIVCKSDPKEGSDLCVPKLRFSDDVDERSARHVIKWIEAANAAGANELLLEINTFGGSVRDGFEMARAIEESEAPVTCIVDGDANSMGFYILQSCEHRYMTPRSKLMAHEPAIGGMFGGQPNQWQAMADMIAADRDALAVHCQHRLKISLAEYHAKTDGSKMWWLLPAEAVKVAAVDGVKATVKSLHKEMLHPKKRR